MALHFDLTNVKDSDELYTEDGRDLEGITKTLVFATLNIGMNEITEENAGEFWARVSVLDNLIGPFVMDDDRHSLLTREAVVRRIGLKTNAVRLTRNQWLKEFLNNELDRRASNRSW